VDEQVKRLQAKQLAGPIRSTGGFYIIAVLDRRRVQSGGETRLRLTQLQFPAPAGQEAVVAAEAARVAADIRSCAQAETVPTKTTARVNVVTDDMPLSRLPGPLREVVTDLPVGTPSDPLFVQGGILVLIVCLRETDDINRDEIAQSLERERLDLLARRYLRDLRRDANIEIRI